MTKDVGYTVPATKDIIEALRLDKSESTLDGYCSTLGCIAANRLEEYVQQLEHANDTIESLSALKPLAFDSLCNMLGDPVFIDCSRPRWFLMHSVQPVGTAGRCIIVKDRTGAGYCFPVAGIGKDWTAYARQPYEEHCVHGYAESDLAIVASLMSEGGIDVADLKQCVSNLRFAASVYSTAMATFMDKQFAEQAAKFMRPDA